MSNILCTINYQSTFMFLNSFSISLSHFLPMKLASVSVDHNPMPVGSEIKLSLCLSVTLLQPLLHLASSLSWLLITWINHLLAHLAAPPLASLLTDTVLPPAAPVFLWPSVTKTNWTHVRWLDWIEITALLLTMGLFKGVCHWLLYILGDSM